MKKVLALKGHFPGRERDEHEVKGYYAALAQVEQYAALQRPITEKIIQTLHVLVMSNGRTKCATDAIQKKTYILLGHFGCMQSMPS